MLTIIMIKYDNEEQANSAINSIKEQLNSEYTDEHLVLLSLSTKNTIKIAHDSKLDKNITIKVPVYDSKNYKYNLLSFGPDK